MDKILYLNDEFITLLDVRKFLVHDYSTQKVGWDDIDGLEQMIAAIPSKESVAIIADFIDDNQQMDWVVKLFPWEKPSYEKRIKDRAHAERAMFVHINWLDSFRENLDGRNEQAVMISTVYDSQNLNTIFTLFEEAQTSVKAIYSYSFLIEAYFLKKLAPALNLSKQQTNQPFMLVFRATKFNFRQIFFNFGRLNISRNIELEEELENDDAINTALVHETQVAIKYLYNQKVLPFNSEVGFIYINSHGHDEQDVSNQYRQSIAFSNWDFQKVFILASDLYTLANVKRWDEDRYATIDFMAYFVHKSKPKTFYKNAFLDKILLFSGVRNLSLMLAIGSFFIAAYFAINSGVDDYLLQDKIETMQAQIESLHEEKNRVQGSIDLKYDAEDIKAAVNFSESLLKIKVKSVLGFNIATLSNVLSRHKHIIMVTLDWKKVDKLDSKEVELTMTGYVFPFTDAYEEPVKWVDELVQDFKKQPKVVEATLTKEPLDRSLKKSLVISSQSDEEISALPFTLQLIVGTVNEVKP